MPRVRSLGWAVGVVLVLAAACALLLWEPWHGPVVLALSESHGVDAGDLPALLLIVLAVVIAQRRVRDVLGRPGWLASRGTRAACATAAGALLLAAGLDTTSARPLIPAGGGTFDGRTLHADGRRPEPVGHWSHLALTYDGRRLTMYLNGTQVSRRDATGTILKTAEPLWIGGNHPYGEYFRGAIDEVRVHDRALSRGEIRAEMSEPAAARTSGTTPGLVAAYGFNAGSGTVAADVSRHRNAGTISGAAWTTQGRFGRAVRFDRAGDIVRVPASPSLNLTAAMTLSAWVRPTESQSGWRTVLHRETDAYFLMAAGGSYREDHLEALDDARAALLATLAMLLLALTVRSSALAGRRRWHWPPLALFVAGSACDVAFAPSVTLIGPTLVAMWCALTAKRRAEAASMYLLAAAFSGVTVLAGFGVGGPEAAHGDGAIARSAALGLLLITTGLLSAIHDDGPAAGDPQPT